MDMRDSLFEFRHFECRHEASRSMLRAAWWVILFAFVCVRLQAEEASTFDGTIRPLLAAHCVRCHGAGQQQAELRLDSKPFAMQGGYEGPPLVPGDPAGSLLYQRIASSDPDQRMPPEGDRLTEEQIAAVKSWIEAGAVWPDSSEPIAAADDPRAKHWSLQPVSSEFVHPASVDGFIQARLREHGLSLAKEADRRTLIRRLTFDLHGLPPTPEEVARFVNDPDPEAYEKLVDELLASPHYGQRWARHWLDIAHYADTHGFERDQVRPHAWRYRDYVIASLNADKPYDQFLREQIAGDIYSPDQPEAVIATGFLAAGPWDFVGQVETKSDMLKRAARAGDLDDMVTQVITCTMGITIHCARCHDHKLDPITQREYYSLWSVFAGVKRGDRDVNRQESQRLLDETARLRRELSAVRAGLARYQHEGLDLADMVGGGDGQGNGVKGRGIDLRTGNLVSEKLAYHRDIKTNRLQKIEWPADVPESSRFVQWVFVPDGRERVTVAFQQEVSGVPATSGDSWDAIRHGPLNAQRHTQLQGVDYASPGHSLLGLHANSGITFDLVKLRKAYALSRLRFTAVVGFGATDQAAASRADFLVYVDTEPQYQQLQLRKDQSVSVELTIPETAKTLTLIATDGGDGIGSDLLFLGDARLAPDLSEQRLSQDDIHQRESLRDQAAELETRLRAVPEPSKVYAVVAEPETPVVRVLRRGDPEEAGVEVLPAGFAWARHAPFAFGDLTTPEGERRRALAEWIVHPANPLTPRVIVNRLWHHHFGQGLVATPSDFGLGGDRPSHPELLDWLAASLVKRGWSLKQLHKRILTSATYRQQSVVRDDQAKRLDAQNRWLWRQNPRRLDAESLHDAVLAVSGRLNAVMGGPGFRDFKYTEAYAPIYDYVTPDQPELWRRSIYRFIVRTTPHRFLTTLDCPDPANLTPARVQTTTALQALTLSNNDFMLRQSQYLAQRVEREAAELNSRVRRAFALCFQRSPTAAELAAASKLTEEQGLFALCRMLLNANEFIYLD
jgi:mono/diheme cytochrome c family protein